MSFTVILPYDTISPLQFMEYHYIVTQLQYKFQ